MMMIALGSGCAMKRAPTAMVSALMKQSDPELVRTGAPAYLLLLDMLVESDPDNADYRLAAADAGTAYASAFLNRVEPDRARLMYAQSRDHGLVVLGRRNKAFDKAVHAPFETFEKTLTGFKRSDAAALYTTATAWSGWIVNSPDSMEATSQLCKAVALMETVLDLDPSHRGGAAELYFAIYYAVRPRGAGQDLAKSQAFFQRAMEHGGRDSLLVRVAYAEFYARYAFDQPLFEKTLRDVLAHEGVDRPELRLMNAVSRQRARDLLERVDDFF